MFVEEFDKRRKFYASNLKDDYIFVSVLEGSSLPTRDVSMFLCLHPINPQKQAIRFVLSILWMRMETD
jgi:hypothetical protein